MSVVVLLGDSQLVARISYPLRKESDLKPAEIPKGSKVEADAARPAGLIVTSHLPVALPIGRVAAQGGQSVGFRAENSPESFSSYITLRCSIVGRGKPPSDSMPGSLG